MPLDPSLTVTLHDVPVYDEGIKERWSANGPSYAERRLTCAWADRLTLINAILGSEERVGDVVTVNPAGPYPHASWLVAQDVDVDGFGLLTDDAGMVSPEYAKITIRYGEPPPNEGTDAGGVDVDFSTEVIALPTEQPFYKFVSDDTPVPPSQAPAATIVTADIIRVRANFAGVPENLVETYGNTVNNAALFGKPAGTLRFDGASTSTRYSTLGTVARRLVLRWKYLSVGWNKLPRVSTGQWESIVTTNGGNPPYASADHSVLVDG